MNSTLRRNEDLIPLLNLALQYFKAGDVRASAVRSKINTRLAKRGYEPKQFWADMAAAGKIINK